MSLIIQESINYANSQLNNDWSKIRWATSPFKHVREASSSEKGRWGENLTAKTLTNIGYLTSIINGGIGDYDLLHGNIKIEHKLATLDGAGNFQFNSIDKNKDYNHVWCVGVAPEYLCFKVVSHGEAQALTTMMTKDGGGYKLQISADKMWNFTESNLHIAMNDILTEKGVWTLENLSAKKFHEVLRDSGEEFYSEL